MTTYLALQLWYDAHDELVFLLKALLPQSEHDYVASRLQCLPLLQSDAFVLSDALCELGSAQKWVLLLCNLLVGRLIHAVVTLVDQVGQGVLVRDVVVAALVIAL